MRLFIQIPCFNEAECLAEAVRDLPRRLPGIRSIEVLVIDDGSSDGTADLARSLGVHYLVRFPRHRGLAAAYLAGLEASYQLGADLVVNTDADNQYPGSAIPLLLEPLLAGRADLVIGDRQTDGIPHFSPLKRWLQRQGSRMVRWLSGTRVEDATSGFRAMSRTLLELAYVHYRFTYTLETIVQAGSAGLTLENVRVPTNPHRRTSKLVRSLPEYVLRNGITALRAHHLYFPGRTFGWIAGALLVAALPLGVGLWKLGPSLPSMGLSSGVLLEAGLTLVLAMTVLAGLLAEIGAANRRILEAVLQSTRRIERRLAAPSGPPGDVEVTGAAPWVDS